MKRVLAIGLLVICTAIPARAATVVVSNCRAADATAWQAGSWQSLARSLVRTEESPDSGAWVPCSVVAGDFDDFAAFSAWWIAELGRPLSEIRNAADLEAGPWLVYGAETPNPAALLFLQGLGIPVPTYPPFDPYDPESIAAATAELEWLWAEALPALHAQDLAQGLTVEAWLAPTSPLPVPEPGTLALAAGAPAVAALWARGRAGPSAARRRPA